MSQYPPQSGGNPWAAQPNPDQPPLGHSAGPQASYPQEPRAWGEAAYAPGSHTPGFHAPGSYAPNSYAPGAQHATPGTYAPAGMPTPMYALRPLFRPVRALGQWALVLAAIQAALFTIGALFAPTAAREWQDALAAGTLDSTFTAYDGMTLLNAPFAIAASILGVVWLWRARQNTLALNPNASHSLSKPWVIFGWAVPIVSAWFPYLVVRDVVRNSVRKPLGPVLGIWWFGWLASLAASYIGSQLINTLGGATPSEAQFQAFPFLEAAAAITTIVAAFMWARIILTVCRDQHSRAGLS